MSTVFVSCWMFVAYLTWYIYLFQDCDEVLQQANHKIVNDHRLGMFNGLPPTAFVDTSTLKISEEENATSENCLF